MTESLKNFCLGFFASCALVNNVTVFCASGFNAFDFFPVVVANFVFDGDYNGFFINICVVVTFVNCDCNLCVYIIAVFECYCCKSCACCNCFFGCECECYNALSFINVERLNRL